MYRVNKKNVKIDFEPLSRFIKGITDKYAVRVGIFGEKNPRDAQAQGQRKVPTNAEVGVQHEFGVPGRIPIRSFLRMPIQIKSREILAQASADAKEMVAKGEIKMLLKRIGIACENAIQEAFDTKGFGKWKENAVSTIRRKKGGTSPLIDTGQLRRSITSKVVEA